MDPETKCFYITHQKVALEIGFYSKAILASTEIQIYFNTKDVPFIKLHSRSCDIHAVYINDENVRFALYDPCAEICQNEAFTSKQTRNHNLFNKLYELGKSSSEQGELAIEIPKEIDLSEHLSPEARKKEIKEGDEQVISLPAKPLLVKIEYVIIDPEEGITFSSNSRVDKPTTSSYLFTLNQPGAGFAKCWVPTRDDASERFTWELDFLVTQKYAKNNSQVSVVSSGVEVQDKPTLDSDRSLFRYFVAFPCPAYLISFSVGQFESLLLSELEGFETDLNAIDNEESDSSNQVTAYAPIGWKEELRHSTQIVEKIMDFYISEFGSYPLDSVKLVFLQTSNAPLIIGAEMIIISLEYLHSEEIIDQTFETRRMIALALASQWFGVNVVPKQHPDVWLVLGLSGFMASLFLKSHFGLNEYRYRMKQDMIKISQLDVNRPPLYNPHLPYPYTQEDLSFIRLKGTFIMYMLDKQMVKGAAAAGLHRLIPKILMSAMMGELGPGNMMSTHWLIKTGRKLSGIDLRPFAEQWIYSSGCPKFKVSYSFNRKKMVVEIDFKQTTTNDSLPQAPEPELDLIKPCKFFTGNLTVCIQEPDGTPYEHVLEIQENVSRFEVQFNTKYKRIRRNTKRFLKRKAEAAAAEAIVKDQLEGDNPDDDVLFLTEEGNEHEKEAWRIVEWGEADEESLESATFEWIRLDSDFEWICIVELEQPDYMWAGQLEKDRDVVSQYEAVEALKKFPKQATSTTLLRTVMNSQCYYRIRADAAMALVYCSLPGDTFIGRHHLLRIYHKKFCIDSLEDEKNPENFAPKPNDFSNLSEYFVQKALVLAISSLKDESEGSFGQKLLLNLLQNNDNSSNSFSDSYYVSTLISGIGNILTSEPIHLYEGIFTPTAQALQAELKRYSTMDHLIPSYHNVVTVSCLQVYTKLFMSRILEADLEIFMLHSRYGNFMHVRMAAFDGLLLLGGILISSVRDYMFKMIESDPEPFIRIYLSANVARTIAMYVGNIEEPITVTDEDGFGISSYLESTTQTPANYTKERWQAFQQSVAVNDQIWCILLNPRTDCRVRNSVNTICRLLYDEVSFLPVNFSSFNVLVYDDPIVIKPYSLKNGAVNGKTIEHNGTRLPDSENLDQAILDVSDVTPYASDDHMSKETSPEESDTSIIPEKALSPAAEDLSLSIASKEGSGIEKSREGPEASFPKPSIISPKLPLPAVNDITVDDHVPLTNFDEENDTTPSLPPIRIKLNARPSDSSAPKIGDSRSPTFLEDIDLPPQSLASPQPKTASPEAFSPSVEVKNALPPKSPTPELIPEILIAPTSNTRLVQKDDSHSFLESSDKPSPRPYDQASKRPVKTEPKPTRPIPVPLPSNENPNALKSRGKLSDEDYKVGKRIIKKLLHHPSAAHLSCPEDQQLDNHKQHIWLSTIKQKFVDSRYPELKRLRRDIGRMFDDFLSNPNISSHIRREVRDLEIFYGQLLEDLGQPIPPLNRENSQSSLSTTINTPIQKPSKDSILPEPSLSTAIRTSTQKPPKFLPSSNQFEPKSAKAAPVISPPHRKPPKFAPSVHSPPYRPSLPGTMNNSPAYTPSLTIGDEEIPIFMPSESVPAEKLPHFQPSRLPPAKRSPIFQPSKLETIGRSPLPQPSKAELFERSPRFQPSRAEPDESLPQPKPFKVKTAQSPRVFKASKPAMASDLSVSKPPKAVVNKKSNNEKDFKSEMASEFYKTPDYSHTKVILNNLSQQYDASPFLKASEIPIDPAIDPGHILLPKDLRRIRHSLKTGQYESSEEVFDDCMLVFNSALQKTTKGSTLYKMAKRMKRALKVSWIEQFPDSQTKAEQPESEVQIKTGEGSTPRLPKQRRLSSPKSSAVESTTVSRLAASQRRTPSPERPHLKPIKITLSVPDRKRGSPKTSVFEPSKPSRSAHDKRWAPSPEPSGVETIKPSRPKLTKKYESPEPPLTEPAKASRSSSSKRHESPELSVIEPSKPSRSLQYRRRESPEPSAVEFVKPSRPNPNRRRGSPDPLIVEPIKSSKLIPDKRRLPSPNPPSIEIAKPSRSSHERRRPSSPRGNESIKPTRSALEESGFNNDFGKRIVSRLDKHPSSVEFRLPVDTVNLNIPHYLTIIKKPMDLSTVRANLNDRKYKSFLSFNQDVKLIFSNACLFNKAGDWIYQEAKKLEAFYEKELYDFRGFFQLEHRQALPQFLSKLQNHSWSQTFIPPTKYSETMLKPIDLEYISSRIDRGYYKHYGELEKDFREMLLTSFSFFNESDSQFNNTLKLEGYFVKYFKRFFPGVECMLGSVSQQKRLVLIKSDIRAKLEKILKKMTSTKAAQHFMAPVDYVALNIPQYPDIIRQPMDFGTIRKNLLNCDYKQIGEFEADVKLVFTNCYAFNGADSYYGTEAKKLENIFDKDWATFTNQLVNQTEVKNPTKISLIVGPNSPASSSISKSSAIPKSNRSQASPVPEKINRPLKLTSGLSKLTRTPSSPGPSKPLHRQTSPTPPPRPTKTSDKQTNRPSLKGKDLTNTLQQLLNHIKTHPSYVIFGTPVDPGIPQYQEIVKKPMDFGTIQKKLRANKYLDPRQFFSDATQVFTNCFLFNYPKDPVYKMGKDVEHEWLNLIHEKKLDKWLDDENSSQGSPSSQTNKRKPDSEVDDHPHRSENRIKRKSKDSKR